MFKKINEFMGRKYVGIDILNGKLKAYEIEDNTYIDKSVEEICPETSNSLNNGDYLNDFNVIKKLLAYVKNNTKKSLFGAKIFVAIPFGNSQLKTKEYIAKAVFQSKWNEIFMVDNYLCSAVGSGIDVSEIKRKIYIYSSKNITYIGFIFAGGTYNVKIVMKGYNELTAIDIENSVKELLNEASMEIPVEFTKVRLANTDLNEITSGWRLEIEKKIYLSMPQDFKNKFGYGIGEYELIHFDNEDCILEGLKKMIVEIKGMKLKEIKKSSRS